MLREIFEFFRKEKKYLLLFFLLVAVYGILFTLRARSQESRPERASESAVLDTYKKAEKHFQEKVKDLGSLEAYFKDNPKLGFWVDLLSLLLMVALGIGLILDFCFFFRRGWRKQLELSLPPPAVDWKFSLLFKFFIWFFIFNLGLSFVLMTFRKFLAGDDNFYILLHTTGAELISFGVIAWLLQTPSALAAVGLRVPPHGWFREMLAGWTGYLILLPLFGLVLILVIAITELLHYEAPPHPLVPILLEEEGRSPWLIYYSLFLATIFGPVFEEVFFRGFCYPILKKRIGVPLAMVATAAFFAFIHDNTFAFWPIFVLGLGLVYLYEKRGSLIAPLTLHITHNLIFLAYFFFTKSIISREIGS